jgi:FkbM family methyltransferase
MKLSAAKRLSISLGLYKPVRSIHRLIFDGSAFASHRKMLSQFIRAGDLAFDIGANIGDRTEMMLSLGASVIAFEPQMECAKEIRARGNSRLTVVEKAVGATDGIATFHVKEDSTKSTLIPNLPRGREIGAVQVPVTTIDIAIKQFGKPNFCKIDVEGAEADVFRGLSVPLTALCFEYRLSEAGTETALFCLEKLSLLGQYELNLTGQEGSEFVLPNWPPMSNFKTSFLEHGKPHYYGDIYARLAR